MEIHSVPLHDVDGGVFSVLSVTRDISERKQAEAALRGARIAIAIWWRTART